jgi:hypothetical protein
MVGGAHGHEDRGADTDRGGVQQGDPRADHPRLLQRLDPPPTGGGGEADAFRQLAHRQIGLPLQGGEDPSVDRIEFLQAHGNWNFVLYY